MHLHDTYVVIASKHIFWLLAFTSFVVWALYLLTKAVLYSKALTWTHVIITILTLGLFAATLFSGKGVLNPRLIGQYDYSNWDSSDMYTTAAKTIVLSILILLFGQIIYIINLIAGLGKRMI